MVLLGILMILAGLALGFSGYMICFRGKYALISHFVEDKHAGKFDNAYARRVGMILLCAAILFLLFGIIVLVAKNWAFTIIALILCGLFLAGGLIGNSVISSRK